MSGADDRASAVAVSVVMPAFNESDFLEATVVDVAEGMRARKQAFEILVCENGSTDDTASIAGRLADKYVEVRIERLDRADYGAALRHGLLCARGEVVVNFDVDYYDLGFLDVAVAQIATTGGAAIVVGSKRSARSHDERPALRKLVTATFATILRVLFGLGVSDTHGMKAMRRADVVPLAEQCRFGQDLFDTELILRAERARLTVAEVPVVVAERRPARTSVLRRVPRTLLGLMKLRVTLWRERV